MPYLKSVKMLGGMLWPVAAIGGLIVLWVLMVIICASIGPLLGGIVGSNMLL